MRFRDFRETVSELSGVTWPDWPIRGPLTVVWVLKFMASQAGTPKGWHLKWVNLCKLQPTDNGVQLHEQMCNLLELMVSYDQLEAG
eukprot:7287757-Karenia_brevis.AAC.1